MGSEVSCRLETRSRVDLDCGHHRQPTGGCRLIDRLGGDDRSVRLGGGHHDGGAQAQSNHEITFSFLDMNQTMSAWSMISVDKLARSHTPYQRRRPPDVRAHLGRLTD